MNSNLCCQEQAVDRFSVLEVDGSVDVGVFVGLSDLIYAKHPLYNKTLVSVPERDLCLEDWKTKSWVVMKNGEAASRLTAIIYTPSEDTKFGFFSDFETINCQESANLLFLTAVPWFYKHGVASFKGPMTPHMGDSRGILVEGQDAGPCLGLPFSPPYYDSLLQNLKLSKSMDMFSYRINSRKVVGLGTVADFVRRRNPDLNVRTFDLNNIRRELQTVTDIYNAAWKAHWSFIPVSTESISNTFESIRRFFDPSMGIFLTKGGKDIGVFLSAPNILQAQSGNASGISSARGLLFGVLSEHQRKGYDAVLLNSALDMVREKQFSEYEIGWILESNTLWINQIEKIHKGAILGRRTFRIYEYRIEQ